MSDVVEECGGYLGDGSEFEEVITSLQQDDERREIKFRAWDRTGKKMFYNSDVDIRFDLDGNLFQADDQYSISEKDLLWNQLSKDSIELMQYTGLKDKNGVEIYEGDVVKRISSNGTIEIVSVKYQAPAFNIGDFVPEYGYIVIGNIYENPELLK